MAVESLFVTSALVFTFSTLLLIVCVYRNSAMFVSKEWLVLKFSGHCGVGYSLPRSVYSGCARCAAHTLWNWTWRFIFQIVRSRESHKKARKIIVYFPDLKVCAISMYIRPRASAEIFPGGGNVDISVILFQVAEDAMQMDLHTTLYPFYTTKKIPHSSTTFLNWGIIQYHHYSELQTTESELDLNYSQLRLRCSH